MAKKDNNIGLSFTADVADLKTGIKQIQDSIKKADKDFKANTASLDKWSKSSEGLSAKLTQLNTKLSNQEKAVDLYKNAIEEASKKEGDHSAEIENLKSKLQDAEIAVAKTKKEINHYSESLAEVQKQEQTANSELGKLTDTISKQEAELKDLKDEYKDAVITYGKNSKEAKALKGDIKKLSGELDDNKETVEKADKALENLEKQFDDTADSAEDFSKGVDGLKSLGGTVAKGVGAVAAGVGALTGAFLATAEGTREFRTNMSKLETGFETSGLKAEQAAETYKNLFGVVADEGKATEATAMLGQLADNQKDLNDWTNILTGVYATFGDSLPIEGLAEAALETSKTGAITGSLADALNWAGISEDKFQESLDECITEQERQDLITRTLNKTYDEASKKYQQANKDIIENNKAQVNLSDTMAKFGEKAEPILTVIKEGFNSILQEVLSLMEDVDFEAIGAQIEAGFSYFIDTIIPAIIDGFQWIMDNKETILAGIVGIGTAMLAWNVVSIIQGVVKAIKAWTVANEGLTVAQKLLNLAMKANPIGIVITIITGLIATIVTLWNTNEDFRNAVINIWNKVKDGIAKAIEIVKTKFNEFKAKLGELKDKAKEVLDKIVEFFKSIPDKLGELKDKMLGIGKNLIEGLWNGIDNAKDWIIGKIKGFTDAVLGGIKKFFGVHSPSKEMAKIGEYLDEGLAQGIEKGKDGVLSATSEVGQELLDSFDYLEDELAKKEIGAKLNILNIKSENPFENWSLRDTLDHIKEARAEIQETNDWIAQNGLSQEKWGQSTETMSEYAQKLKTGYEQIQSQIDAITHAEEERTLAGLAVSEKLANEKEQLKQVADLYKDEMGNIKKVIESSLSEGATSWVDSFTDALGLTGEKMNEWANGLGSTFDKVSNLASSVVGKISEIGDAVMEYQTQQMEQETALLENELTLFNRTKDEELAKQQALYDNGMLNEEQFAAVKLTLEEQKQAKEKETLRKKNALAKKQFEAEQKSSLAQALIQGALAIVTGFAQLGPIGGAINAVAQAAITGVQTATILSQKYVPMLAKGGIVDSPTLAMIGEDGSEAVVPLKNNTEWIHNLAEKLNEIMSKDFSWGASAQPAIAGDVVNNYNYSYNQTINSPTALSRKQIYRDTKNLLSLKGTE